MTRVKTLEENLREQMIGYIAYRDKLPLETATKIYARMGIDELTRLELQVEPKKPIHQVSYDPFSKSER